MKIPVLLYLSEAYKVKVGEYLTASAQSRLTELFVKAVDLKNVSLGLNTELLQDIPVAVNRHRYALIIGNEDYKHNRCQCRD